MGQIQVALISLAGAGDWPNDRGGVLVDPTEPSLGDAHRGTGLLIASEDLFDGFGNSVILAEDLRNPA